MSKDENRWYDGFWEVVGTIWGMFLFLNTIYFIVEDKFLWKFNFEKLVFLWIMTLFPFIVYEIRHAALFIIKEINKNPHRIEKTNKLDKDKKQ